ncbi:MAG: uncharacterized protein A8A55_0335 [Amphiamblys sp. WSBS2006]|nr:MAG: uncharacterized protein A8A55_0335 [Amphiamblys sp. WSBS2006]
MQQDRPEMENDERYVNRVVTEEARESNDEIPVMVMREVEGGVLFEGTGGSGSYISPYFSRDGTIQQVGEGEVIVTHLSESDKSQEAEWSPEEGEDVEVVRVRAREAEKMAEEEKIRELLSQLTTLPEKEIEEEDSDASFSPVFINGDFINR